VEVGGGNAVGRAVGGGRISIEGDGGRRAHRSAAASITSQARESAM